MIFEKLGLNSHKLDLVPFIVDNSALCPEVVH